MTKPTLTLAETRDFAKVATLMNEVWSPPSWEYSAELLADYLDRDEFCCPVGAEVDGKLVGFIGGMPFRGSHREQALRGIFTSFYTAHPKASVYGVSGRLLSSLAEHARGRGVEWYLTLLEVNPASQPLIEALHRRAGLAVRELLRVEFWVGGPRFLQIEQATRTVTPYRATDLAECEDLLRRCVPRDGIANVPSSQALAAILGSREPAWLWREGGRLLGAAVFRRRGVRATVPRINLHGDWVLFAPEVERPQKIEFLRSVLAAIGLGDIAMVVLPRVGACDGELLREMRFLQGPRSMALYAAHLHDKSRTLEPVQRALIEVF